MLNGWERVKHCLVLKDDPLAKFAHEEEPRVGKWKVVIYDLAPESRYQFRL